MYYCEFNRIYTLRILVNLRLIIGWVGRSIKTSKTDSQLVNFTTMNEGIFKAAVE